MFQKSPDERLSLWSNHRRDLESTENPFELLLEFWSSAPYVPYNRQIDPYNPRRWPTPWEIIVENKYDDFTKALMMAWTLKLTDKFKDSKIEIKTYTDERKSRQYNLIFIDEEWVINYNDDSVNRPIDIPDSLMIENLIEVARPR
jgi:hypothetical protein